MIGQLHRGSCRGPVPDQSSVKICAEQANRHKPDLAQTKRSHQPRLIYATRNDKTSGMKSAYELAMARLEADAPSVQLTEEQKERIAAIEARGKADIAAKELLLQGEMQKAAGQPDELARIQRQLASEIARIEEKRDREKDEVRSAR
jgi:hypothetical protein